MTPPLPSLGTLPSLNRTPRASVGNDTRADEDGGLATVWTAVVATACLAVVGLVLDGGAVLRAQSQAFDTAGGAARAGAQHLDQASLASGQITLDEGSAAQAAQDWLATQGASGDVAVTGDEITVTVQQPAALQILRPARVTVTETATATARQEDLPS